MITYATTTCSYTNPVDGTGAPESMAHDPFAFASSTCLTAQQNFNSTTTVPITNSLTSGDVLIAFFLFVLIIFKFGDLSVRSI